MVMYYIPFNCSQKLLVLMYSQWSPMVCLSSMNQSGDEFIIICWGQVVQLLVDAHIVIIVASLDQSHQIVPDLCQHGLVAWVNAWVVRVRHGQMLATIVNKILMEARLISN